MNEIEKKTYFLCAEFIWTKKKIKIIENIKY